MGGLYGFAGRTLHVDLTTGAIASEPLERGLAERFVGGMGIGAWLAYRLIEPEADPLSPENPLVFSVGPLVGTLAPAASRVFVTGRSPDSGLLLYSNAGHSMGVMMKYAGYDNLVVRGRAERPVYLWISSDGVEIRDAGHLWGKDSREATDLLLKEVGDGWVDCIGPAAERLVRYSIILCSKRSSFNKTGPGTIMGAKNLKAIAAHGTGGVRVADPERFIEITDRITKAIVSDPELRTWRAFGASIRRDQPGYGMEEWRTRVMERPYACPSCPVACKHAINLRGGPYEGLRYRVSNMGALVGHNRLAAPENWDELAKAVEAENLHGVEASVAAGMLSYLVECHAHGLLTEKEIGFAPRRGGGALRGFVELVARREGIGGLAAEGFFGAIRRVGEASERYALHHKGVGREHRLDKEVSITTIGSLTNPRGGKGEFAHINLGSEGHGVGPEQIRRFLAEVGKGPKAADRLCRGPDGFSVGRLTRWAEDFTAAYTAMGLCFREVVLRHIDLRTMSDLYRAATGIDIQPRDMIRSGECIFNLFRAFNVKMGMTRRDDLPSRGATWPPDGSLVVGGKDYGTLNQVLDEYYDERGWDVGSGAPTRRKLEALGLSDVADDLGL